ncbi:von Willebrand factor A domain-containing protein 1-like [Cetorhinus maximus]
MFVNSWLSLCLTLSVLGRGFQQPEDTEASSCRIDEGRADILLAIDGSGSVMPHEFASARGLLEGLVGRLALGPGLARVGLLQVAGRPVLELLLGGGTSREAALRALGGLRQLLGDTNSGRALAYAARRAWAPQAGGRPQATRLLLWVTDGYSSDRPEEASGLLRRAGVHTFVVTTGRRDKGLSQLASSTSGDFLIYTDPEELPGLADRLCRAFRELLVPPSLRVSAVTDVARTGTPAGDGHVPEEDSLHGAGFPLTPLTTTATPAGNGTQRERERTGGRQGWAMGRV